MTRQTHDFSLKGVHAKPLENLRAVLFDLDGTLIDHFRVIYRCYCHALDQLGMEPVTYEKVKSSVGGGIVVTFGKLIPEKHVEEAVRHFRAHFDRIWHEEIEVLPGSEWLLDNLRARGLRLAVFTNKDGSQARRLLDRVGLSSHLDGTYGALDTPWNKPHPEFTRHVLAQLGTDPAHALMIGDSPYDVEAANVAGMPCYTVATGSHSVDQLRHETEAKAVYPDLYALGKAVFNLPEPAIRSA